MIFFYIGVFIVFGSVLLFANSVVLKAVIGQWERERKAILCSSQSTGASDKNKQQYLVLYHGQEAMQPRDLLKLNIALFVCVLSFMLCDQLIWLPDNKNPNNYDIVWRADKRRETQDNIMQQHNTTYLSGLLCYILVYIINKGDRKVFLLFCPLSGESWAVKLLISNSMCTCYKQIATSFLHPLLHYSSVQWNKCFEY